MHLNYLPSPSLSVSLWARKHCLACVICLLWRADLWLQPSLWMSTIQDLRKTWLAARSLLTVWWKMPSLELRLQQPLAFQLWLSHACLSASGEGGHERQLTCSPWCSPNPLFYKHSRDHHVALESLVGTFPPFCFCLTDDPTVCVVTLAPSDCPQGIKFQSLP